MTTLPHQGGGGGGGKGGCRHQDEPHGEAAFPAADTQPREKSERAAKENLT